VFIEYRYYRRTILSNIDNVNTQKRNVNGKFDFQASVLLLYNRSQEEIPMKTLAVPAIVIFALVFAVAPLWAHHSWPVNFDRLVTVKGTVIQFTWANPHPMMILEVQNSDGKMEKWEIGGPAVNRMEANGWTKNTVKPGDMLTGIGYQFSDGQKIIRLERVILADGKEMRLYGR
jgi:hypothetical protein